MSHSSAFVTRRPSHVEAAERVVWKLEQLVEDHGITAAGRELARTALPDARAVYEHVQRPPDVNFGGAGELVPMAEVDAAVAFFGRRIRILRDALEETDQLARAGDQVGYESAYRILRRAVAAVLEEQPDVP